MTVSDHDAFDRTARMFSDRPEYAPAKGPSIQRLTITVPSAPVSGLMPNQESKRGTWHRRAELRREAREIAMYSALNARPQDWQTITGPVALTIHVAWPKGRRPDLETVVSASKPFTDGLADAGILADDKQITEIHATHTYGATEPGYTVFTITESEDVHET